METIYSDDSVSAFKQDGKYFIRYDAGAHQVEMREDEISEADATQIQDDPTKIEDVLRALQRRLKASGVNPYKSNCA